MDIEAEARRDASLDMDEMRRFQALAHEWWDERGKFRGLHAFNPARVSFVVSEVQCWGGGQPSGFRPLDGLRVLDIGCGGGILSEPLARLGGEVTAIDPVEESIGVASAHAAAQGLKIGYRAATAETLAEEGLLFDVVIASEVAEHVQSLPAFFETCRSLCKLGGLFIVSTLNRTAKSYALAIVAAERFLGLIPPGTHDWKKFITPLELDRELKEHGFKTLRRSGLVFKPFSGVWVLSPGDLGVNYAVSAEAV